MRDTSLLLFPSDFPEIRRKKTEVLQVNLGYLCNLSCTHCHVNAGPKRTEMMDSRNIDLVIAYIKSEQIGTLDLTGGAPEMNPDFRRLVQKATSLGVEVVDRCNLTIFEESGQDDTAEFLAKHQVTVTASLPCYSEQNVREQRGKGVFEASIRGLQRLNKLGYGKESNLQLNLVYNPNGAFLPPDQQSLEQDYKNMLSEQFGIQFNQLFTITNMPIQRFGATLLAKGDFHSYMSLLKDHFSAPNLQTLMCKTTISVDWQGYLYDCDFNQMLNMPMEKNTPDGGADLIASSQEARIPSLHLSDLLATPSLATSKAIKVADHCYGCTAGQGSSCGGALA